MMPVKKEKLTPEQAEKLLLEIIPEDYKKTFAEKNDVDFSYDVPGVARLRANIFRDRYGAGGVFRMIPADIKNAKDLSFSKPMLHLCCLSKGLVLVTGPTGSGKSTTMAGMIDTINETRDEHIITVEDPVEFLHENKRCLINQREIGTHTESFASALRAALREDPDIVLVGEMRDLETTMIAIETAETGHLVFGTLHTTTASSTVDRMIDQFPADRQDQVRTMLAASLAGVVSQTLLRRKDGKGMVAAREIMIMTNAIRTLIREKKSFQIQSQIETGQELGMALLNDSIQKFVKAGIVSKEEALFKCIDKDDMKRRLQSIGDSSAPPRPATPIAQPANGAGPGPT
jgi:twitching motility protein PilT